MIEAHYTKTENAEIASPARKAMVYVVDDDSDVLKSLRFLLETEGFDVRTFRSGSALLGSRTSYDADCLIIDYKMTGIDGIELTYKLRDLGVRTPIILITGHLDQNIPVKAGPAGVYKVLLKPHLEDSLVATVRSVVA